MINWQKYWDSHPQYVDEADYLRQVGKTVHGVPISDSQFEQIIAEISGRLELESDDRVLDLCCGNGLITHEISKRCREIIGVDFSLPLITIARKHHQPANVRYIHRSILALSPDIFEDQQPFSKVYMYEALQHFRKRELVPILKTISQLTDDAQVVLGSIPDRDRIWSFYNTVSLRRDFLWRRLRGREAIGTWWQRDFIEKIAGGTGYQCEFFNHDNTLHTSHYRFDVRLRRSPGGAM